MIKTIIEVRKKINFEKLNMRIGLHTVNHELSRVLFLEVL